MNKEYIYIDGTLIVEDEKFKKRIVDYTDSFEEVLKQENLIEKMENEKEKLETEMKKRRKNKKSCFFGIICNFVFYVLTVAATLGMFYGVTGEIIINTSKFGLVNFSHVCSIFFSSVALLAFGSMGIGEFLKYKKDVKKENAINSELEFLEKEIEIEKEKLEELNDKKNVVWPTTGIKIAEVDDKELLENLKKQLELHYNIGYNSQKYFKYLENGILEEKLRDKNYTEEEIECISKYLEEKGPILSRKK